MSDRIKVKASSAAPGGHFRAGFKWLPTPTEREVTPDQLASLQQDPRIKIHVEPDGPSSEELQLALSEREAGLKKWESDLAVREDVVLRRESELSAREASLKTAQQALEKAKKDLDKEEKALEKAKTEFQKASAPAT